MPRTPDEGGTAEAAARAAAAVPGVAYLSPRLADRLRSRTVTGVSVRWRTEPESCAVDIALAVAAGHQAARVAQEVRGAVVTAVRAAYPQVQAVPVAVSVTVTAVV